MPPTSTDTLFHHVRRLIADQEGSAALRGTVPLRQKVMAAVLGMAAFVAGAGLLARHTPAPAAVESAAPSLPSEKPSDKRQIRRDQHGDPLPAEAIARLGTMRLRHAYGARTLAFTSDGKELVSYSDYDGLRIWDSATGRQLRYHKTLNPSGAGALSPDGKLLVMIMYDGKVEQGYMALTNVATGRVRRFGKRHAMWFRFSLDGRFLAAFGMAGEIEVWDTASRRLLQTLKGHKDRVLHAIFSADGQTLISGSDDKTIRFWDTATGKERRKIETDRGTIKLALSPDGKVLASLGAAKMVEKPNANTTYISWRTDEFVRLLDVATGKETRRLGPDKDAFQELVFAPDGKTIFTVSGKSLGAWDAATGRELRRYSGFEGVPFSFALSPDGKMVAAEDGRGVIRQIDVASGKDLVPVHGHQGRIGAVAVTPDGRAVLTASWDGTLRFWDPRTGRQLRRRTLPEDSHPLFQGFFRDDRTYLVTKADKTSRLYDLATGKELAVLRGHTVDWGFALSPDRQTLVSVDADRKTVRLLDPPTGETLRVLGKIEPNVSNLFFTAAGRDLLVWGGDKTIRVWNLATGKKTRQVSVSTERPATPDSALPWCGVLSPDGQLLAFREWDSTIYLVDVASGRVASRFAAPGLPGSFTFSPDGKTLAWVYNSIIHLGEIATGRERHRLLGHDGGLAVLAFSADGKRLVSGAGNTTAIVWDLTGRLAAGDKWDEPLSEEELGKHWNALAGDDAVAGWRAMQRLTSDPTRSVPYLSQRLRPVPAVAEKRLARLIADLDGDEFAVREKASAELEKLGEPARHTLRQALAARPTLEMRRRLEKLIDKLERERWSPTGHRLRAWRALEVLERAGTSEAKRLLAALAGGAPEARLTREAQAVLERLGNRP